MNDTILIVEDEVRLRFLLRDYLKKDGFTVLEASDGEEALNIFSQNNVNLIVLDVMMPKLDGFNVCKAIRKVSNVPVILLTAKSQEEDKLFGYEIGADDYITKPFSVVILHKRIEALLRRIPGKENTNKWLYKDVEVDFLGFSAKKQGKTVDLKPKEIKLLELLLKYKNQVLTRSQMLDNLWDVEETPLDRVIDVYIKNIRKKLGIDCIITVKGIGYKFEEKL